MSTRNKISDKNWQEFLFSFELLSKSGVLGLYSSFQVVEILAFPPRDSDFSKPILIYSIFTCTESVLRDNESNFEFLNDQRISSNRLKGWSFGIAKHEKSIEEVWEICSDYINLKTWNTTGKNVSIGNLSPIPKFFVPSDSFVEVPLNKLIKNNFNGGSYLLELCDLEKNNISIFLDDSELLQEISQKISRYIPINISSLSERLGNVIFQFPVTILMSECYCTETNDILLNVSWHPKASKRKLCASLESVYDNAVSKYYSVDVVDGVNNICENDFSGSFRFRLWDKENNLLLSASSESSFIKTFNFQMNIAEREPRSFKINDTDIHIQLFGKDQPSQLGKDEISDVHMDLIRKRLFRDEILSISARKEFIQYGKNSNKIQEHNRAIQDLRFLIDKHGESGVWLWDPYLSSNDLLKTLFYSPHFNADLKALSGGLSPFKESCKNVDWAYEQESILTENSGNKRGLNLEFRFRNGNAGWAFHDRYIIFPKNRNNTALAWSLGTSVNSMGHQHHTLQKVLDGELIKNAFFELWNELQEEQHLIWKS